MVDLLKLFIEKPLNAIVAMIAILALFTYGMATSTKEAVAIQAEQQKFDSYINEQVLSMKDTLIRIDANVAVIKEQQKSFKEE